MEPSRTGAADACRVVLSTPIARVDLTHCQSSSPVATVVGQRGVERHPIRDGRPALSLDGERARARGGDRGLPPVPGAWGAARPSPPGAAPPRAPWVNGVAIIGPPWSSTGASGVSAAPRQSSGTWAMVRGSATARTWDTRPPASSRCSNRLVSAAGMLTTSILGGIRSSGKSSAWLVRSPTESPSRGAVTAANRAAPPRRAGSPMRSRGTCPMATKSGALTRVLEVELLGDDLLHARPAEVGRGHVRVDTDGHRERAGPRPRALFVQDRRGEQIGAGAAVLLVVLDAQEAHLAHARPDRL